MISLSRRYPFSASHRLHVDAMSEADNTALFGKCNNPFGHGHDYVLCVTVTGVIDSRTGLVIRVNPLDDMVKRTVLDFFSYRNINLDVPQFAELVPTTENVAAVIAAILEENWSAWFDNETKAHLSKVQIQETDRNGFEIDLRAEQRKPILVSRREKEGVMVDG